MVDELLEALKQAEKDASVRCVVLTGRGSFFSTGHDVSFIAEADASISYREHLERTYNRLIRLMHGMAKPIIGAINGDAVGLGATLALFCDVVIAAEKARFGDPHVRVGIVAGDGGAIIWPALIGVSRAKEYLMTGKLINAIEGERIGLVNHAVPQDEVMPKARELAQELADGPTWAIRFTKVSVNKFLSEQVNLILDASLGLEMLTFNTADHKEATKAWVEKRKPQFKGC